MERGAASDPYFTDDLKDHRDHPVGDPGAAAHGGPAHPVRSGAVPGGYLLRRKTGRGGGGELAFTSRADPGELSRTSGRIWAGVVV